MRLPDVNVLVSAHRPDLPHHAVASAWLREAPASRDGLACSDAILSSFVRITTNRRIFREPSSLDVALAFARAIRSARGLVHVAPGARHWDIFESLLRDADARGPLVTDAWFAAMAIESGCEWVTFDADFARFPGLRWTRLGAA